jgi:branched-chain amino acid transport system substrate-binding protein
MRWALRNFLLAASLLTLHSLLSACGNDINAERVDLSQGVPLGGVLAISGMASVYGVDQNVGLALALEEINNSGGINGLPLHLSIQDSGSDEVGANAAFTLLMNQGVLAIIGPTLSQQAVSAGPIAQRRGVPVVVTSNTATGIPQIGRFITGVAARSGEVAPLVIAKVLEQNPDVRRVAVFYARNDAYSTAETTDFQQALAERGLEVVSVQSSEIDDIDFKSQIRMALEEEPDLVVLSHQAIGGVHLIQQLKQAGYDGPILAGNGMNTPTILSLCGEDCDGLVVPQAYSPELPTPTNAAFLDLYRRKAGEAVPPEPTVRAYVALQVIGEALRRLDRREPLKATSLVDARNGLIEELLAGHYQTPIGDIHFTPEGEVVQKRFFVARVSIAPEGDGGRFSLLK